RERESLHAVAVKLQVPHLRREQGPVDGRGVMIAREQRPVALVHLLEDVLAVPERVVGIESDHAPGLHGWGGKRVTTKARSSRSTALSIFASRSACVAAQNKLSCCPPGRRKCSVESTVRSWFRPARRAATWKRSRIWSAKMPWPRMRSPHSL